MVVQRDPAGGVPQKMSVTLRYVDAIPLNAGAAKVATYVMRANGIYDPDYTGTGHQPMTRDTWAGLFGYYTVKRARCTATFYPMDTQAFPLGAGVILSGAAGIVSVTPYVLAEQPHNNWTVLTSTKTPQTDLHSITQVFDASKFFTGGVDDDQGALIGNNPADAAYFTIWLGDMTNVSVPTTSYVTLCIDYDCEFTYPVEVSGS